LNPWNYLDMLHIVMGYTNIVGQMYLGIDSFECQLITISMLLVCLAKTFFYLRVSMELSILVTMIIQCISDLKIFMFFYMLMILIFSAIYDVLIQENEAVEYRKVNAFIGNFLYVFRLSLGDFDVSTLEGDGLTRF
jgi:hypothetical protein